MKLALTKPKILAWGVDPRKQSAGCVVVQFEFSEPAFQIDDMGLPSYPALPWNGMDGS